MEEHVAHAPLRVHRAHEDGRRERGGQELGARRQSARLSTADRQQIVGCADRGAEHHQQHQIGKRRNTHDEERGDEDGEEDQAAHRRRSGFAAMRLRSVLVRLLANPVAPEKREQDGAGGCRDHEAEERPNQQRLWRNVHDATARTSGLAPSPRHLSTTSGVCSSLFPCGLPRSASSTLSRQTPDDAPSTLALPRSLASTTAQAAPQRRATSSATPSASRGAKTIARSYGGIVPVYPSNAATASPRIR